MGGEDQFTEATWGFGGLGRERQSSQGERLGSTEEKSGMSDPDVKMRKRRVGGVAGDISDKAGVTDVRVKRICKFCGRC